MAYTLPALPYAHDALEPHVDARTMEIHHGKHHQAYITKVNDAISGTELENKSVEDLVSDLASVPEAIRGAVRNNGGGRANHSLFWTVMGPNKGGSPTGELAAAIDAAFGSLDSMKEQFSAAAATRFGSGWAWLVIDTKTQNNKLKVMKTLNAENPMTQNGIIPILTLDCWEHSYYLDYQNLRPKYINTFLDKLIDWDFVQSNLP